MASPSRKFLSKRLSLLLIIGILLSGLTATSILLRQKNVEPPSLASGGACSGGEDDFQGCTNGGDLRNGCNWICNNAPSGVQLVPPPCCETLAQTGDPFACCFDARRRCTPQQCAAIPEGVIKQRCGQLWELGYCSGGGGGSTPKPTNKPQPSNTPRPTRKPRPTKVPTFIPTATPIPPTDQVNPTDLPLKDDLITEIPPEFDDEPLVEPTGMPGEEGVSITDVLRNFLRTFSFGFINFENQKDSPQLDTEIPTVNQPAGKNIFDYIFEFGTKVAP
ncbi:hypothetical protein HYW54_04980 [Candidatus Gottesmanbacteria bacterium]|nr:hypothetical protein [Candidatus Gottesmanbacteria bacterium]